MKVGPYTDKTVDIGPITNKASLERIRRIYDTVEKEGATFALDGRGLKVKGYESGNFIGPTIITNLKTHMTAYKEEIFGPSLCVLTADSLDEAMNIINAYISLIILIILVINMVMELPSSPNQVQLQENSNVILNAVKLVLIYLFQFRLACSHLLVIKTLLEVISITMEKWE